MEKRKGRRNPTIRLRPPEQKDSLALMDFFNPLIEEDVQINYNRKVGYEEEIEWLKKQVGEIARGELVMLVAEENGKIIGAVEIRKGKFRESHTGELGVSVGREFRGTGLGARLIRTAIGEAKKIGVNLVWLQVFSTNIGAMRLYERLDFRKEALLKKRLLYRGKYVDKVIMCKRFSG